MIFNHLCIDLMVLWLKCVFSFPRHSTYFGMGTIIMYDSIGSKRQFRQVSFQAYTNAVWCIIIKMVGWSGFIAWLTYICEDKLCSIWWRLCVRCYCYEANLKSWQSPGIESKRRLLHGLSSQCMVYHGLCPPALIYPLYVLHTVNAAQCVPSVVKHCQLKPESWAWFLPTADFPLSSRLYNISNRNK